MEARVQQALKAFREGRFPNAKAAALKYNAPYGRMKLQMHKVRTRSERAPTNRLLTDAEELGLCL